SMVRGASAMTTEHRGRGEVRPLRRRGEIPPQRMRGEIPPQRKSAHDTSKRVVFKTALQAERAGRDLIDRAERSVETLRQRVFSNRLGPADVYDEPRSEISAFLKSCQQIFWALAAFSGLSNLLMLTGSFFMLQVYDRVLPGRSIPTLVALMA